MAVTLQPEELELVRNILADYLSNLRMEIANTEDYDLRQTLKAREAALKSLLDRMNKDIGHRTQGIV
jgi:hypothetical protein